MVRLTLAAWIANAAVVLDGVRGEVTRRAARIGCSRQALYRHRDAVAHAVAHQAGPGPDALLDEVERLREENRRLWDWLDRTVDFPPEARDRFVVSAAAIGLSLNQVVELLGVLMGLAAPSRSAVHRTIRSAQARAGAALGRLDAEAAGRVTRACLDEVYAGNRPILMGVEPASLTWFVGADRGNCRGATWAAALAPWHAVTVIVADAGSGLQAGIAAHAEASLARGGPAPDAGLDVFHTIREARSALARSWRRAEADWEKAEDADAATARVGRQGKDRRGHAGGARTRWKTARRSFTLHERAEAAWRRAHAALGLFSDDGRLNDAAAARATIDAAVPALKGPAWAKVRNLLARPESLAFLGRMHRDLAAAEPDPARREAMARLWWLRRRPPGSPGCGHVAHLLHREWCRGMWPDDWRASYERVAAVLRGVVRASSAVECVNGVVRMHQDRHRRLPQGLIDLKRLHWNCHRFRAGRRKGRSPYEILGLTDRTPDFWQLLNATPAAA